MTWRELAISNHWCPGCGAPEGTPHKPACDQVLEAIAKDEFIRKALAEADKPIYAQAQK